nr:protein kinase-like domain-containing protein [Tanacetum cinerariifolium]
VIPIKINLFAWKVQKDRLPCRLKLSRLGIDIPCLSCPMYDSGVESMAHLLFACPLARAVLAKVRRWWSFSSQEFDSYEEIPQLHKTSEASALLKWKDSLDKQSQLILSSWVGNDPCQDWRGIGCNNASVNAESVVTHIQLQSLSLTGKLNDFKHGRGNDELRPILLKLDLGSV